MFSPFALKDIEKQDIGHVPVREQGSKPTQDIIVICGRKILSALRQMITHMSGISPQFLLFFILRVNSKYSHSHHAISLA